MIFLGIFLGILLIGLASGIYLEDNSEKVKIMLGMIIIYVLFCIPLLILNFL